MAARRNPFEALQLSATPPSLLDSLRVAAPRKRNRTWEKQHQAQKVVYRGVDPKLAVEVKAIAQKLRVPEGEVARALIEYALQAYAEGDLDLDPRPDPDRMRMTLFPSSGRSPKNRVGQEPARSKPQSSWRVVTTWRGFPPELRQEISVLASDDGLDVPVGELVSALLRHGLKAYEASDLKLQAVAKDASRTLAHGGKA